MKWSADCRGSMICAPDHLKNEFADALALAGGKCIEALERHRISQKHRFSKFGKLSEIAKCVEIVAFWKL